jgi:hypothetical protein
MLGWLTRLRAIYAALFSKLDLLLAQQRESLAAHTTQTAALSYVVEGLQQMAHDRTTMHTQLLTELLSQREQIEHLQWRVEELGGQRRAA